VFDNVTPGTDLYGFPSIAYLLLRKAWFTQRLIKWKRTT